MRSAENELNRIFNGYRFAIRHVAPDVTIDCGLESGLARSGGSADKNEALCRIHFLEQFFLDAHFFQNGEVLRNGSHGDGVRGFLLAHTCLSDVDAVTHDLTALKPVDLPCELERAISWLAATYSLLHVGAPRAVQQ